MKHAQATPGTGHQAAPQSAAQRSRPFAQASKHGSEIGPSYAPTETASQSAFKPEPLPATGYLRRVRLQTTLSGGGGTTPGVGAQDYPFNLFSLVRLSQPNGAPICELSGFHLLLANIYGGYAGAPDPRVDPDYSSNASNPSIEPFVPLELDPTAVGSLSNLSNASAFRLTLIYEADATVWTTVPNPVPAVATDVYCDFWTLPEDHDENGVPQETVPPFPGTIQLWTQIENISVSAGNSRKSLERVGNQLRTVILVCRDNTGARNDSVMPNPTQLRWDDVLLQEESPRSIRKKMREYVNDLTARDVGVYTFPYSMGFSRFVGGNGAISYMPTVTATRFELSGAWGAAGTISWLVNDVTSAPPAGVQRATVGGGLGYYPPAPAPSAGTQ